MNHITAGKLKKVLNIECHPGGCAAAPPGVVVDHVILKGHIVAAVCPGAQFNF